MTDYTPTTEALSRLWLMHHLANSPDMKHDPDGSEADDGFREWMQAHNRKIAAEAWDEGHAEGRSHHAALHCKGNPYRADRIERGGE